MESPDFGDGLETAGGGGEGVRDGASGSASEGLERMRRGRRWRLVVEIEAGRMMRRCAARGP